ncbi:COP9 signalosome complex subunit 7b-like isoform X2 [Narcine bancroftii]
METKGTLPPLEQFLLQARQARGAALEPLVDQLLEAPGVYVFGDFLEIPSVKEIMEGPYSHCYQLLHLFAYGTFSDYVAKAGSLPELSLAQKNKLRHLSIVTMADRLKCIPYSLLLRELDLSNLRDLEDLIIEAIYADIIHGKLDQRRQTLEVDCSLGRDIRPRDVQAIASTLQDWCNGCETVLAGIEDQIARADQYREHHLKIRHQVENEVVNLKKTLKATSVPASQDTEQQVLEPRDSPAPDEIRAAGKKMAKVKGCVGWALHSSQEGLSPPPGPVSCFLSGTPTSLSLPLPPGTPFFSLSTYNV